MTQKELDERLCYHAKYLLGTGGGTKVEFRNEDLRDLVFSDRDLRQALFLGCDLTGAEFNRARLGFSDFQSSNITDAMFSFAEMNTANMTSVKAHKTNFVGAYMTNTGWRYASLQGADLTATQLERASFVKADLREAKFSGAWMYNTNLRDADLRGSSFAGTSLNAVGGVDYAQCSWMDLGQSGRLLTLVNTGSLEFFCGCFRGTPTDLCQYIKISHAVMCLKDRKKAARIRDTRLRAMHFCLESLGITSNKQTNVID